MNPLLIYLSRLQIQGYMIVTLEYCCYLLTDVSTLAAVPLYLLR